MRTMEQLEADIQTELALALGERCDGVSSVYVQRMLARSRHDLNRLTDRFTVTVYLRDGKVPSVDRPTTDQVFELFCGTTLPAVQLALGVLTTRNSFDPVALGM